MPGIALNEDNSHYFVTRAGQELDVQTVQSWVDQYADTQVKELMLCPCAMRASYASTAFEPIWASRSPCRSQGVREADTKGSTKASRQTPSLTASVGATR